MGELAKRKDSIDFEYQGKPVKIAMSGNNASLTDYWIGAGRPENKQPKDWLRQVRTKEFIAARARTLKVSENHLIRTVPGKGVKAGTYVEWQIGIEYARYLSANYAQQANDAYAEWVEEQYDPGLKLDRGRDLYKKMDKDDEWIEARFKGIGPRKDLMHTVKIHNGAIGPSGGQIYPMITDAMSVAITKKTTSERKVEKGLAKKGNLRDHMTRTELAETALSEMWAKDRIVTKGADGPKECLEHCVHAARTVAEARAKAMA